MSKKTKGRPTNKIKVDRDSVSNNFSNDYTLDHIQPQGNQVRAIEGIDSHTFNVIDGPSGSGKTTIALWWALMEYRARNYSKIIFIKNPTEAGDDKIGFLTGDENDKLQAHMAVTKEIFNGLMSPSKRDNDIRNGNIELTIPNFKLGATFDNSIVIIDETQTMSRDTVKLLTERCGKDTKYILLGDSSQRYSVSHRSDGFKDFIDRVTEMNYGVRLPKIGTEGMVSYTKLLPEDNQRSIGSKFINTIYEKDQLK